MDALNGARTSIYQDGAAPRRRYFTLAKGGQELYYPTEYNKANIQLKIMLYSFDNFKYNLYLITYNYLDTNLLIIPKYEVQLKQ